MNSILNAGVSHRRSSAHALEPASADAPALSLGVSLADAAPAGVTVNPVQTTTYDLKPTTNAITFGSGTKINAGQGLGVYGTGAAWSITNSGSIDGSVGIYIHTSTADIVNSGSISGYDFGVSLAQGGEVTNRATGYIQGITEEFSGSMTVANAGLIGHGVSAAVYFRNGGDLTNLAGGRIDGEVELADNSMTVLNEAGASITTSGDAIAGSATIYNRGSISAGLDAISFVAGTLTNRAGAQIYGFHDGFVGEGAIVNAGTISGGTAGLSLEGATFANESGGVVEGGAEGLYLQFPLVSLTNTGEIRGTGSAGVGVTFVRGGNFNNKVGGTVSGVAYGILGLGYAADITNAGSISSTNASGIDLFQGGAVTNAATGDISGTTGVYFRVGSVGAVTNAGVIVGSSDGVQLNAGGQLTNRTHGVISGQTGVSVSGFAGTIVNAGTIEGTADSVVFSGYDANKLTLQAGSKLVGAPVGSTAFDATNALILQGAGAAANWFQNFNTLDKQWAGTWTLSGESAIGSTKISAGALIVTNYLRSRFNVLSGATLQIGDATHGGEILGNGAFANGGVIQVDAGLADVTGAVSGAGSAVIAGGTLEFDSSFTQNVAFTGKAGVLQLAKSQSYTGSITGFSLTGANSLDLRDIGFTSGTTKATYVDNGSHTGGVLTVTDGTHSAHINMVGNFSTSTLTTSSDSHGGTTVVDPQAAPGVSLATAAPAATVNPVQTTTYHLKPTNNPITFGATTDIDVTASGQSAVVGGTAATYSVTNEGNISSISAYGIHLMGAGSVTNSGTIGGYKAVDFAASGKLINTGAVNGSVLFENGGSLDNEKGGRITDIGHVGVTASGAAVTLNNAGYIYGSSKGVFLQNGGKITNAAGANLFGAEFGVVVGQSATKATVVNSGAIGNQEPAPDGSGLQFDSDGGTIENLRGGAIYGFTGMQIGGEGVTLINAGAIEGESNTTSGLVAANDTIVNQKGGRITGQVSGVILDGGSVTNAGSIGGGYDYGVLLQQTGTVFNKASGVIAGGLYGASLYGMGASVTNAGSIVGKTRGGLLFGLSGTMSNWATGTVSGTSGVVFGGAGVVINAGHIVGASANGLKFEDGGSLNNAATGVVSGSSNGVYLTGGAGSIVNAGQITAIKSAGVGVDLADGGVVTNRAGGAITATYGVEIKGAAGTVTNAGTIKGSSNSVEFTGSGANTLTLQTGSNLIGAPVGSTASGATNALILQGTGAAASWFQNFTSLNKQGTGIWTLSGTSAIGSTKVSAGALIVTGFLRSSINILKGATLQVGDATHASAAVSAGGAFTNNGVLQVNAGLADIFQAVGGTGGAVIAGGTLEFDSSFTQNVAFTGASGVLQLAKSQSYTGSISGFSLTGANALDLRDIGFTSGTTKATYADNGSHTGGVLTVTDGTHTANIKLVGNFSGSTFTTSSDNHGGTTVVDPQAGPAVLPLIAAMASFGADAGHFIPIADSGRSSQPLLALAHSGG